MKNNYLNKIKHRFQHLPLAYTGLALGIGGIFNCVSILCSVYNYNAQWISYIGISIMSALLLIVLIRFILHPKILCFEINDPMSISLLPTFFMSLFLFAGFLAGFNHYYLSSIQIISSLIMCLALLGQLVLIVFFIMIVIKKHIKSSSPAYGSYFVPTVGLIVACTVANKFTLLPALFFQIIWFIGFASYVFSFPIVTYVLLFGKNKVDKDRFPTVAVWFAPTNLTPAGFILTFLLNSNYLQNYYPQTFLNIMFFLTTICGFSFCLILYFYVLRIFKEHKFSPIFCSITFPTAIAATSMVSAARYINKILIDNKINSNEIISDLSWFFGVVGIIFSIISFLIIFYIFVRMVIFTIKTLLSSKNDYIFHETYYR